jgi:CARDB
MPASSASAGKVLMRILDRHRASAALLCTVLVGCGSELPDLTVTADHKDGCVDAKPQVELLNAKIVNAGPGAVVLEGDDTKPWVIARPSLPTPDWARRYVGDARKTLNPGDSVSIPIKVIVPPHPDNAPDKLIVEVDPKNAYPETDETNNEFAIPVPPAPCS